MENEAVTVIAAMIDTGGALVQIPLRFVGEVSADLLRKIFSALWYAGKQSIYIQNTTRYGACSMDYLITNRGTELQYCRIPNELKDDFLKDLEARGGLYTILPDLNTVDDYFEIAFHTTDTPKVNAACIKYHIGETQDSPVAEGIIGIADYVNNASPEQMGIIEADYGKELGLGKKVDAPGEYTLTINMRRLLAGEDQNYYFTHVPGTFDKRVGGYRKLFAVPKGQSDIVHNGHSIEYTLKLNDTYAIYDAVTYDLTGELRVDENINGNTLSGYYDHSRKDSYDDELPTKGSEMLEKSGNVVNRPAMKPQEIQAKKAIVGDAADIPLDNAKKGKEKQVDAPGEYTLTINQDSLLAGENPTHYFTFVPGTFDKKAKQFRKMIAVPKADSQVIQNDQAIKYTLKFDDEYAVYDGITYAFTGELRVDENMDGKSLSAYYNHFGKNQKQKSRTTKVSEGQGDAANRTEKTLEKEVPSEKQTIGKKQVNNYQKTPYKRAAGFHNFEQRNYDYDSLTLEFVRKLQEESRIEKKFTDDDIQYVTDRYYLLRPEGPEGGMLVIQKDDVVYDPQKHTYQAVLKDKGYHRLSEKQFRAGDVEHPEVIDKKAAAEHLELLGTVKKIPGQEKAQEKLLHSEASAKTVRKAADHILENKGSRSL